LSRVNCLLAAIDYYSTSSRLEISGGRDWLRQFARCLEANCPGAGLVRVIFLLRRKAYQCVGEKSLYCCSLLLGLPSSLIGIASYRPVRRIVKVHGCRSSTATEECIRKSAFCVHLPGAIHRTSQTEPVYVLIFFSFFLHNGSARYGLICPDERGNEILVAVW
jgi:hypothetical protein